MNKITKTNIPDKFKSLPDHHQVLFFIILADSLIKELKINEYNICLIKVIEQCREWLLKKAIPADALYWELENLDDTGILSMMQDIEDEKELSIWICIANVLAFTTYQAYKYQGEKYLPQTIESVDPEEMFEDIITNLKKNTEDPERILNEIYESVRKINTTGSVPLNASQQQGTLNFES